MEYSMPPLPEDPNLSAKILKDLDPEVKSSIADNIKASLSNGPVDRDNLVFRTQTRNRYTLKRVVSHHTVWAIIKELGQKNVVEYEQPLNAFTQIRLSSDYTG